MVYFTFIITVSSLESEKEKMKAQREMNTKEQANLLVFLRGGLLQEPFFLQNLVVFLLDFDFLHLVSFPLCEEKEEKPLQTRGVGQKEEEEREPRWRLFKKSSRDLIGFPLKLGFILYVKVVGLKEEESKEKKKKKKKKKKIKIKKKKKKKKIKKKI